MLYPMFVLVLLTNAVMIITARARVGSVNKGTVSLKYYALMQGQEVPEFITKSTRHFSNLFEVPTLFYAGGAVYLALGLDSRLAVACAWAFVVARTLHTFIHLGYNNVMHRLLVFGLGNLAVLAMWIAIMMAAE
jgi:hypothetical protein